MPATAFDRALVRLLETETVEQLAARLGLGEEDIRIRAQGVADAEEKARQRQAFTGWLFNEARPCSPPRTTARTRPV